MFNTLTTPDKIQIISIFVSSSIAIASIIIAIATLRQTKKITEDSNRPYIVVYSDIIHINGSKIPYVILKNFGKTGAVIDWVKYYPEIKIKYDNKPFSKTTNHFLAPNQKITSACFFVKPYETITFEVKYHYGKKSYVENYTINPKAIYETIIKSTDTNSDLLSKTMSRLFQELIRTNL